MAAAASGSSASSSGMAALQAAAATIAVTLKPDKKGVVFKHVEYEVVSAQGKVVRRYSDFYALHEVLSLLFPYRALPSPPPALVGAYVNPVKSDFSERRRAALARFLVGVVAHPVAGKHAAVQFFLTHLGNDDCAFCLKQLYGPLPDEMVSGEHDVSAVFAASLPSPAVTAQLAAIASSLTVLLDVAERSKERAEKEAEDISVMSTELGGLKQRLPVSSPSPSSKSESWSGFSACLSAFSSGMEDAADHWMQMAADMDAKAMEQIRMLQDVLQSLARVLERASEKSLGLDSRRASDRVSRLRPGGRAVGTVDPELLWHVHTRVERLGAVMLDDAEARAGFARHCLAQEVEWACSCAELLGGYLFTLSKIQSFRMESLAAIWRQLKVETVCGAVAKQLLSASRSSSSAPA